MRSPHAVFTVLCFALAITLYAEEPPATPSLSSPGGTGNTTTPMFQWSAVDGATSFELWVDNLTTNTSQVIHETALTGTSFTPATELTDNQSYRAWIRAGNGAGYSGWSSAKDFGVGTGPAAAPTGTPTQSAPTGTNNSPTPQFAWGAVTAAVYFDLWVDDITTGTSQVIRSTQISGTTFTPTSALTSSHTYRSWVRAGNVFGYGSWSSALDFGVGSAPSSPPATATTITAPNGSGNPVQPEFTWTAVTDATSYDLWLDDLTTSTSQVIRQTVNGLSFTPTSNLVTGHSYRAWVQAGNVLGVGPWSTAHDFGVGTGPAAAPTDAPTINAPIGSNQSTTPTFQWTTVTDATSYELWIDNVTTSTSQVIHETSLTSNSFTPTTELAQDNTYRTWVRAGNVFGYGPWSQGQVFGTGTGPAAAPTDAPTITAPVGSIATTTPTFTWTTVSDSSFVELWVDDLTTTTSQVIHETELNGSFTPGSALMTDHTYRTWIRAGNVLGYGPWSSATDFAIGNAPVAAPTAAPTITAPTTTASPMPTFVWTNVTGADHFDLWVDDVTAGTQQVIRQQSVSGTSYTATTPLTVGDTYRTWVRAGNVFGFGPWSSAQDFAVVAGGLVIATPASANPNPVTGAMTTLSVLASDDAGEATLTYQWATTGNPPASVTFSPNGTNAAKSSVATFTALGAYDFTVTVTNTANQTVTSSVHVVVNEGSVVAVSPSMANVNPGQTKQFTAVAQNQFGAAFPVQPTFTWSVDGGGTIDTSGLFTAGATLGGPFTVTATGNSVPGTATVYVRQMVALSGVIDTDQTLSGPYDVVGDVTINAGVTVHIQAGTVFKFESLVGLFNNGTLIADGTPGNPIYFTSWQDDSPETLGDTNGDGNATVPAQGDWTNISSYGDLSLTSCIVRYAGGYSSPAIGVNGPLNLTISGCTVTDCLASGISSNPSGGPSTYHIQDNTVKNCDIGIDATSSSSCALTLTGNELKDNASGTFSISPDIDCSQNTCTGTVGKLVRLKAGTLINNVTLQPPAGCPKLFYADGFFATIDVPVGMSLTIPSGTTVKLNGSRLFIEGELHVNGTAGERVYLTSFGDTDDAVGGAVPGAEQPGYWLGIYCYFGNLSLSYCDIRYAGYPYYGISAIDMSGGVATFDATRIDHAGYNGISALSATQVALSNSTISNSYSDGLRLGAVDTAAIVNSKFLSNSQYGLEMLSPAQVVNCEFVANGAGGVFNSNENTTACLICWWGSSTGPGGYGPGTGNSISTGIRFNPWRVSNVPNAPLITNATFDRDDLFEQEPARGVVHINAVVAEPSNWSFSIKNSDAVIVRTLSGSGVNNVLSWDGTDQGGLYVPAGVYQVDGIFTSIANPERTEEILGLITVAVGDITPPVVAFLDPTNGQDVTVSGLHAIFGTATDENLSSFTLEVGEGETPVAYNLITTSSLNVDNGILGYWDTHPLAQGSAVFTLRLTATDHGGNTSSTTATITVTKVDDTFPPTVAITSPSDGQTVSGDVTVIGTAMDENFSNSYLEYGFGTNPTTFIPIAVNLVAVSNGPLGTWHVPSTPGQYTLRIRAVDATNLSSSATILVNAVASQGNGNDTSILVKPVAFDASRFTSDEIYRSAYLSIREPGRVWATAEPAANVPKLKTQGSQRVVGTVGSTIVLAVVAAENSPVTFFAPGKGTFLSNGKNVITVQASADGTATVSFVLPNDPGNSTVLAGGPLSSGTIHFAIRAQ